MPIVKSTRPESKSLDGHFVTACPDYSVVKDEDGKMIIVAASELHAGDADHPVVKSSRPHIAVHNGKKVRVIRQIKPEDGNSYSVDVPQVVVAPVDGSAQFTVQKAELDTIEPKDKKLVDKPVARPSFMPPPLTPAPAATTEAPKTQ